MCRNLSALLSRPFQYWYELNPVWYLASAGADKWIKTGNAKTLNAGTGNDLLDETNMTDYQYM